MSCAFCCLPRVRSEDTRGEPLQTRQAYVLRTTELTCGQGARKSAAKTALSRAPLALTVSIDLSASDEDGGDCKGVESPRGLRPPPGKQAAPGRLRCEYEIRIQMVGRGSTLVLDDFEAILSI